MASVRITKLISSNDSFSLVAHDRRLFTGERVLMGSASDHCDEAYAPQEGHIRVGDNIYSFTLEPQSRKLLIINYSYAPAPT